MEVGNTGTYLIPRLIWLHPRRRGPTFYLLVSINVETFIVGGLIGMYIALKKRMHNPREDPEEKKKQRSTLIEFAIPQKLGILDRIKKESWNFYIKAENFAKLVPFFFRTGFMHSCFCCVYRIVTLSEGKLVPTAFTYLIATGGDEDFQHGWYYMARVVSFACVVDCTRLFIFSRTFRAPFIRPFMKKLIEPALTILFPPAWMQRGAVDRMGC